MTSLVRIEQFLKGRIWQYTITKEIQDTVWFAKILSLETVVIKSVQGHPRIQNERDVLKRLQHRTPYLRPMINKITKPNIPVTIALRYLDEHLWASSIESILNRKELKYVSRRVFEALKVLYADRFMHTDVQPHNVLVNFSKAPEGDNRFSEVQLGDMGGYHISSKWANSRTFVGSPVYASPEVLMEMPLNTAADIWSFGAMVWFPPQKNTSQDDEMYILEVAKRQYRFFAPFLPNIAEIATDDALQFMCWLVDEIPRDKHTPFFRIMEREVVQKDKDFIGRMARLNWRDRPTTKEILEDEWWNNEE